VLAACINRHSQAIRAVAAASCQEAAGQGIVERGDIIRKMLLADSL